MINGVVSYVFVPNLSTAKITSIHAAMSVNIVFVTEFYHSLHVNIIKCPFIPN